MYRGETFRIKKADLVDKSSMLGVQLIDCLIGMLRDTLLNRSDSKRSSHKMEFIKTLINKVDYFLSFFESFSIYEWRNSSKLQSVDFRKYIRLIFRIKVIAKKYQQKNFQKKEVPANFCRIYTPNNMFGGNVK
jgi:anionic cell wall polymer biosynthesis LytR-Cps2A-Psr (LCP) family protein